MDELCRVHSSISYPVDSNFLGDGSNSCNVTSGLSNHHHQQQIFTAAAAQVDETHEVATGLEMSDVIKAQIANHPHYPNLLSAYIECKKVGAAPEMASLLEEISKENHLMANSADIGADPELDIFMKSYCEVLLKCKEELSKPFDEATKFLSSVESQLTDLCKETLPSAPFACHSAEDAAGGPYDDDISRGELEEQGSQESSYYPQGDQELKEMVMRKYSRYLTSLRKEFSKKRKKGKLPKDARTALLDWWNTHYRWPYPTEEEKNRLSEMTGLDQKQINNWFINQRKRHWRPSEDMRFTLMEGVSGGGGNAGSIYFGTAGGSGAT